MRSIVFVILTIVTVWITGFVAGVCVTSSEYDAIIQDARECVRNAAKEVSDSRAEVLLLRLEVESKGKVIVQRDRYLDHLTALLAANDQDRLRDEKLFRRVIEEVAKEQAKDK